MCVCARASVCVCVRVCITRQLNQVFQHVAWRKLVSARAQAIASVCMRTFTKSGLVRFVDLQRACVHLCVCVCVCACVCVCVCVCVPTTATHVREALVVLEQRVVVVRVHVVLEQDGRHVREAAEQLVRRRAGRHAGRVCGANREHVLPNR